MEQSPSSKANICPDSQEIFPKFVKLQKFIPMSIRTTTDLYPDPDKSMPHPPILLP